jgi:hypothetical protein
VKALEKVNALTLALQTVDKAMAEVISLVIVSINLPHYDSI